MKKIKTIQNLKYPSKILIVGLGSIGKRYVRLIKYKWANISISALRSKETKPFEELNLCDFIFYNYIDSIKWQPELVIICTPAPTHQFYLNKFAEENIPIIVEKPLAASREDLKKCEIIANKYKFLPISVGYLLRYDPCTEIIFDYINNLSIGQLVSVDAYCGSWLPNWRTGELYKESLSANKELGGGVLLELSHELDLIYYLFGNYDIICSNIKTSNLLNIKAEDQAYILASNDAKLNITIRLDFCTQPPKRIITINGSEGRLKWNILKGIIRIEDKKGMIKTHNLGFDIDKLFIMQLQNIFNSLNKVDNPFCTINDGIIILNQILKAKEIAHKN